METQPRQVGRGLIRGVRAFWQRLTAPFRWLGRIPPIRYTLQLLRRFGVAVRNVWQWFIWEPIVLTVMPLWRLLGRMGIAIRNLWQWFFVDPFLWVARPIWFLTGQVGLALRYGFTWVIWYPLLTFVWRPSRWLYLHTVWPSICWLADRLRAWWTASAPRRARLKRRWRSWWFVRRARWRMRWQRRGVPQTAVVAPQVPRSTGSRTRRIQLTTAFVSATMLLLASYMVQQARQRPQVINQTTFRLPSFNIAVPQPAATATVAPEALPTPTPWPTPDPLEDGGSVAFSWHKEGNSDIYILTVGRAEPLRLTSHAAPDTEPSWSPNGQKIAFSSHRDGNWEVYVYDLSTAELQRITDDLAYDGHPRWSPDGKWLAYESYQGDNMDIYIVRADLGLGPFRLTRDPALDYDPVWTPSGRHIAFTSWRSGNPDIFLMSLDSASDELAFNLTNTPDKYEDEPAFAPDGNALAYHETSGAFTLINTLPLNNEFRPAGPAVSLGQQGHSPTWSPRGDALFYVFDQVQRSHLIAGSPQAWGVTPQAFTVEGRLSSPSWTAVTLTPQLAGQLFTIDQVSSVDPILPDEPLFIEALAPLESQTEADESASSSAPYLLWELPVNAPSPYLNDRIDQSFVALRERVIEEAGWDFLGQLDKMFEGLEQRPLPGQSLENWNQAGRAFDLPYRDALAFEPEVEIVPERIENQTYWRVFVRTAAQDGTFGRPLRQLPWDFRARFGDEPQYYDDGGKLKEEIPDGYYIDFTALAADYGWTRVPADSNWRTYFPGIQFWHYENRQGLTWPDAMREIYTDDELAPLFGPS